MTPPPPPGYPQQPPPYPYAPSPVRRWWQHPALIITALVLIPPGGIALAWLSGWSRTKKIVATALSGVWFLAIVLSDPPKEPQADAKPAATRSTAPTTPAPGTTPSPAGPPSYVGKNLKDARAAADAAG
ncbi:hypothetical protein AB0A69_01745 [Streptomyces sp. NPDC045431]|uniref:hypothetical protein n=1 Tax=Streptomyces sp. NPDC045431 TaxID=3155613 RepID=UPI00340AFD97